MDEFRVVMTDGQQHRYLRTDDVQPTPDGGTALIFRWNGRYFGPKLLGAIAENWRYGQADHPYNRTGAPAPAGHCGGDIPMLWRTSAEVAHESSRS